MREVELVVILLVIIVGYFIFHTKSESPKQGAAQRQCTITEAELYEAGKMRSTELYEKLEKIITSQNLNMIRNDVYSRNLNSFSNIVYTNIVVSENGVAKLQSGGSTGWPDELTNQILFRDLGYRNLNGHQIRILAIALGMMSGYKYECDNDTIKVTFVESYWRSVFEEQLIKRDAGLKALEM